MAEFFPDSVQYMQKAVLGNKIQYMQRGVLSSLALFKTKRTRRSIDNITLLDMNVLHINVRRVCLPSTWQAEGGDRGQVRAENRAAGRLRPWIVTMSCNSEYSRGPCLLLLSRRPWPNPTMSDRDRCAKSKINDQHSQRQQLPLHYHSVRNSPVRRMHIPGFRVDPKQGLEQRKLQLRMLQQAAGGTPASTRKRAFFLKEIWLFEGVLVLSGCSVALELL